MSTVPKSWVWAAATLLFVLALGSVVMGAVHSGPARDAVADIGPLTPVPNATNAKPISESDLDEARIRQIAREEAQAALRSSAPRPKAAPKPDVDAADAAASGDGGEAPATPVIATPHAGPLVTLRPTTALSARPAATSPSAARTAPAAASPSASRGPATSNPYPPGSSPD